MKLGKIAALIVSLSMLSGCATLFANGPSYLRGEVESESDDVTITLTGTQSGDRITKHGKQFEVQLNRASDYTLKVEAPGHETEHRTISRSLNSASLINILWLSPLGIGLGFLVDFATNALWVHQPAAFQIKLDKRRDER